MAQATELPGWQGRGGGGAEFPQGVANNQLWKPNICKIVGGLFKTLKVSMAWEGRGGSFLFLD